MALIGTAIDVIPQGFGTSAVWAQEGDGDGQGGQGQGGQGQGGQNGTGEGDGTGQQGGGSAADGGGKPVWAQEGIPEVELGRLSVARSPDKVLDQALAEAIATLTPEMVDYYNMTLEEVVQELDLNFDEVAFIDSPLQNLALLNDLLADGTALADAGVTWDDSLLAAMLLGAASDKTIEISTETVIAVTTILGTPITGDEAAALADEAEAIRIAILAGHG